LSDKQLIQRCLDNERAAQKLLFYSHKDRLINLLYRYTKDLNASQELLQKTFIQIFGKLHQFDSGKGRFENWTAKIAINQYLQSRRKIYTDIPIEDDIELYDDLEARVLDTLTIDELRTLLAALSDNYRVILNLYYFEEYSHEEIAGILGIEVSSSRSRLSRARKKLLANWKKLNLSQAHE